MTFPFVVSVNTKNADAFSCRPIVSIQRIFAPDNERQVILTGLEQLAFLTHDKSHRNYFALIEVMKKDAQRLINRLLYILKTNNVELNEHVALSARCIAQLPTTSFDKELIEGGFVHAFNYHVPKNPNVEIKRQLIYGLINLMVVKRSNAEHCLIHGQVHKVFCDLPQDDPECQEYVAWFFNSALMKHTSPPIPWNEYCKPLWPRIVAVVQSTKDPTQNPSLSAALEDSLNGMYMLSRHIHQVTQASMLKDLLTPQLLRALLNIASNPLPNPNEAIEYWVTRATAVLSRVVLAEYNPAVVNIVTTCEPLVRVTLPYMLQDKRPHVAEDAVILVTNASGTVDHPQIAIRLVHLVEIIASRLYENSASPKFNTQAIIALLNIIYQLTDQAHGYNDSFYKQLFGSGTLLTSLMERTKFPDPDIARRILEGMVYLMDLGVPQAVEQLTDMSFVQDVSELAFHSSSNKAVSEVAMRLLAHLDHHESVPREMQEEEDGDDQEEYYWSGNM